MTFPFRRIKRFLWARLMARMHLDWTLRSGIRLQIRSYADWCSYNEIFANEEYTRPILDTFASGGGPVRVLDLGANCGYFTLKLADMFSLERKGGELTVWMVEASPAVCAELNRRLGFSRAQMKWSVTNGLVGRRTGHARLNYTREDNQNFVDDPGCENLGAPVVGAEEISYTDLADLVGDVPSIDLIKCDIEGSEFSFLQNYPDLLRKTNRLVIEFHSACGSVAEALGHLSRLGFGPPVILREGGQTSVVYLARPGVPEPAGEASGPAAS